MRKRLTKRVREGLQTVINLAEADAQADREAFPESHQIWAALEYLEGLKRSPTGGSRDGE